MRLAFSLRLLVKRLNCFVLLGFIADFLPVVLYWGLCLGVLLLTGFMCWGNVWVRVAYMYRDIF